MRPGDLPGHQLTVVADVRLGITTPVLELDTEARAELLDVEPRLTPVDSDPLTDFASGFGGEGPLFTHPVAPPRPEPLRWAALGTLVYTWMFAPPRVPRMTKPLAIGDEL